MQSHRPEDAGVFLKEGDGERRPHLDLAISSRSEWDAVIWNGGSLHTLGLGDWRRPNNARATDVTFTSLLETLSSCAQRMTRALPNATRILALSNQICSSAYVEPLASQVEHFKLVDEDPSFHMQFDEIGVASVRAAEHEAARRAGESGEPMRMLASHTDGACACTSRCDGRHYPDLIPHWLVRASEKLEHGRARRARIRSGLGGTMNSAPDTGGSDHYDCGSVSGTTLRYRPDGGVDDSGHLRVARCKSVP